MINLPFHAGIDEAGRGPFAGPVVSACVCFPDENLPDWCNMIADSKKLSMQKRLLLAEKITSYAYYNYGAASVQEIDDVNILNATMNAMRRATRFMPRTIKHFWVDGNKTPSALPAPASHIIRGDGSHLAIAAASILAKTLRDNIMITLAKKYPHYGWDSNMGYGVKAHIQALHDYGITPHHRKSYAPIKNLLHN